VHPFKVIKTRNIFRGKILKVRVDTLDIGAKNFVEREVVEHPGAVVIAAIDDLGRVLLVRQFRHAAGEHLLELPAGTIEPGEEPLATGVRAVDALVPLGRGQRVGVFSAPGIGKSTLLGMMARHTAADVSVIGLVGERGREVRDFVDKILGPEGLARSVVVVAAPGRKGEEYLDALAALRSDSAAVPDLREVVVLDGPVPDGMIGIDGQTLGLGDIACAEQGGLGRISYSLSQYEAGEPERQRRLANPPGAADQPGVRATPARKRGAKAGLGMVTCECSNGRPGLTVAAI